MTNRITYFYELSKTSLISFLSLMFNLKLYTNVSPKSHPNTDQEFPRPVNYDGNYLAGATGNLKHLMRRKES